jgi:phosphatidylserine decarboxylase
MTSFVGALNVGSIKLHMDPKLVTNIATTPKNYDYDIAYNRSLAKSQETLENYISNNDYLNSKMTIRDENSKLEVKDNGVDFAKGEEIGWFEMGSTIVLVFEGPQET